ncbi:MAG: divergent polysaccharide deacetylase family protein [Desulfobulbaceae bacterium]|nr:divergent polysaccharide deacetylase family protein [Desulfobulbaceae bacterium]
MPQPPHNRQPARPHKTRLRSRLLLAALLLAAIAGAITYALHRPSSPPTLSATAKHPAPSFKESPQPPALLPQPPAPPPTVAPPNPEPAVIAPPPAAPPAPRRAKAEPAAVRFVLVIDDMGYHQKIGDALLDLPLDITFAFLPFAPHTESQLAQARARKRDILLHLPMEATDKKWDPGPGALFTDMDQATMHRITLDDLAAIPDAIGVNNHMGSRFTENEPAMRDFLVLLQQRGLFFLDSLTSPHSVGFSVAGDLGMLAMRRNVFLDNQQDKELIKKQLDSLILLAEKQGIAIGIAHPHQATLEALRDFVREHDKSVAMVGISSIARRAPQSAAKQVEP